MKQLKVFVVSAVVMMLFQPGVVSASTKLLLTTGLIGLELRRRSKKI